MWPRLPFEPVAGYSRPVCEFGESSGEFRVNGATIQHSTKFIVFTRLPKLRSATSLPWIALTLPRRCSIAWVSSPPFHCFLRNKSHAMQQRDLRHAYCQGAASVDRNTTVAFRNILTMTVTRSTLLLTAKPVDPCGTIRCFRCSEQEKASSPNPEEVQSAQ